MYHDVLAELLSTESWGVRQSNDAGSANGPDNLQTLQTCACFLWPMSLGANSHTQATGNGRAKQLFLKTSWFLSVLLNGVLHGLAAPQFDTLKIKQTPLSDILEPRIWGLKSFSLKKPKVSQFVDGDHSRTPKCTEG